ncbi:hypothetical protein NDU88_002514 [Pleurodeles waltl]|uniref:Uncharacterized protein n=1 Tax=Pleurodeles waltl TaxID=8319 RepID=A0AAV7TLE6_PLEWA|nr:hypothetical protein NDU88_002514 [Pleurodeles waltl]
MPTSAAVSRRRPVVPLGHRRHRDSRPGCPLGGNQSADTSGNDRQQQPLRTFTSIEKDGEDDDGATEAGGESGKEEQDGEEHMKEEDECRGRDGATGSAGAVRWRFFPVGRQGYPKTASTEKSAEGQEAVCPYAGHTLGRAWPLQVRD